jgi:hypothetical protein
MVVEIDHNKSTIPAKLSHIAGLALEFNITSDDHRITYGK